MALADVAAEFGTPAFVVDEPGLRETAREYLREFTSRHPATEVHFASKALPCAPLTRLLAEEGLGCDVASVGELAIALAAGFDPGRILLHGNARRTRRASAVDRRLRVGHGARPSRAPGPERAPDRRARPLGRGPLDGDAL